LHNRIVRLTLQKRKER